MASEVDDVATPGARGVTDKDFDALQARLIALAQSVFPELYECIGDVLASYTASAARPSTMR